MSSSIKDIYAQARTAAKDGDLPLLQQLIVQHQLDPKNEDSDLLRIAAEHQNPHIVQYLIPLSEPKALNSLALRWACEKPGVECVALLLPHSDPSAEKSSALRLAVTYGNYEAAKLLFDVSDPKIALKQLVEKPGLTYGRKNVPERFVQWWEEHEAAKLKQKLHDSINTDPQKIIKRKM